MLFIRYSLFHILTPSSLFHEYPLSLRVVSLVPLIKTVYEFNKIEFLKIKEELIYLLHEINFTKYW